MKKINAINSSLVTTPNTRDRLGWLITGLIQSDGSFGIGIVQNKEQATVRLNYHLTIELTMTSLPLLREVQAYFGVGSINFDNKRNTCIYSIRAIDHIWHILVPHLLKYSLYGSKQKSFVTLVKVLILIYPFKGSRPTPLTMAPGRGAVYIG